MSSRAIRPIVVAAGLLGATALAGCSAPEAEDHSYTDGIYSALGGYSSRADRRASTSPFS